MSPAPNEPDAPGWYPDPGHGDRLRRWDGSRWTGESRATPPWSEARAGMSTRRKPSRHWLVFGVVAAFLLLAASFKAFTAGPDLPARTVFDTTFISQANEVCRGDLAKLKADRPKPGSRAGKDPGSDETVAATVDDVADRLRAVAVQLRGLSAVPDDRADVAGWLEEWDRYVDLGHQYAGAIREKSPRQKSLAEEGAKSGRRATLFAQANKLDDCMLA